MKTGKCPHHYTERSTAACDAFVLDSLLDSNKLVGAGDSIEWVQIYVLLFLFLFSRKAWRTCSTSCTPSIASSHLSALQSFMKSFMIFLRKRLGGGVLGRGQRWGLKIFFLKIVQCVSVFEIYKLNSLLVEWQHVLVKTFGQSGWMWDSE